MIVEAASPTRGGPPEVQRDRAVVTRAAILQAARGIFAEAGFQAARTNDIVVRAGVTRGALYHHFRDKEDLFEAVFMEVTAVLDQLGRAEVDNWDGDLWSKMRAAFASHLRLVAASREFQRILLVDGPAVLGWTRWREIQSQFVARDTAEALTELGKTGILAGDPPAGLAHLIQAALNDAALSIAHADDPASVGEQALAAFHFLLDGMRRR